MKRNLRIAVALAVGMSCLAFALAYSKASDQLAETERALDRARLQRDYLERAGRVRAIPDEKDYRAEVQQLFRWYFDRVEEHRTRYDGGRDPGEPLTEAEPRAEPSNGEKNNRDKAKEQEKGRKNQDRQARLALVKRVFEPMRAGKYNPLWTATSHGTRLDVISADVHTVNGAPKVRLDLALWGDGARFDIDFKLMPKARPNDKAKEKDKDKRSYEMSLRGDPTARTDRPDRYAWAFPPQMMLGYFDIPLVPHDVAKAEITFNTTSRPPGDGSGEARASYVWKLDVPDEWKLRADEKWEGAEEKTAVIEDEDSSQGQGQAQPVAKRPAQ